MRHELDEATLEIIQNMATKMKRRRVFRDYAWEDICGDLALFLLEEMKEYDATLGAWRQFIVKRLWNKGCDMIRERSGEKGGFHRECVVYTGWATAGDDDVTSLQIDLIPEAKPHLDDCVAGKIDLLRAMEHLPEALRPIVRGLETKSQRALAREMGLSHGTFWDRYIVPLKIYFRESGIGFVPDNIK